MAEKIRKTIYVPEWIATFLDDEGKKYDGPGVVFAAAIYSFKKLSKSQKIKALQEYREREISRAYCDDMLTESHVRESLENEVKHQHKNVGSVSK